jgi:predicted ATPase
VSTSITRDSRTLLADFDAYRYAEVVRRYGGSFFEGFGLELGVELEEWLFVTREVLARHCRSAHLHRARVAIERGELEAAKFEAEAGVGVRGAPELDEAEIAIVLPILQATGSTIAGAVHREALDEGILPSLDRQVDPLARVLARRSAMAPSTSFVGRRDEFARLLVWVRSDARRIITIHGLGGMGKTRLAIRLVDEIRREDPESLPEGAHVVPLEHVDDAAAVFGAIASTLGLPPHAGRDVDALALAIQTWCAVIVLDNFEHVPEAAPDIATLVSKCPSLRVVITSRTRVGLSGEQALRLEGLPTTSPPGECSEAAQVFLDRASRVGFEIAAGGEHMASVDAICAELEGYPLGIELAAGMTRLLPPSEIVAALRRPQDVLVGGATDAPERHRATSSAFEPSWQRLDEEGVRVLSSLAVFRGGFQRDAAAEVAGASLGTLAGLCDSSLLRVDNVRGRFGFHPLVHAFVRSKADRRHLEAAAEAHMRYYAALLEAGASAIEEEPHRVLAQLEVESSNILVAIRAAHERGASTTAIRMTESLVVRCDYTQARGCDQELLDLMEIGVSAAEACGDLRAAHHLATRLGDTLRELRGDLPGALVAYEQARRVAAATPDAGREAILTSLIAATREEHDGSDGEPLFRHARGLAERAGDDLALCMVLQKWGYLFMARGDNARALPLCLEAVEIASRLRGSPKHDRLKVDQVLFFALHNLGVAHDDSGDLERSLAYRQRALALAQERDHDLWSAYAHEELGTVYHGLHDRVMADGNFAAALALYQRRGAVLHRQNLEGRLALWGYG